MTISKATIESDIWQTIYDRLGSVTSVTLTDATTQTIQTYTGSFPDSEIDTKSSYPILVLNPIDLRWTDYTLTKKQVEGSFSIDIYTTKSESADRFRQAIVESIETYRATLRGLGMDFVNLDGTDNDSATRGGFKIHRRGARFSFKFRITKTTNT